MELSLTGERVLVVADWSLDPHAIVADLVRRADEREITWSLLVPAWLHGLDWAGDPHVSHPCAETALLTLRELAVAAGLRVDVAVVGDHEPVTAVGDACAAIRCDAILLCTRHRRFSHGHPLDLAHRMHAVSGVPVVRALLPTVGRGHCAPLAEAA
jgi:nucleotide-binding universal stress UspA family protein